MAHLWIEEDCTAGVIPAWAAVPLDGEGAYPLVGRAAGGTALLVRSRTPDGDAWLIMAAGPTGVAVNGEALRCGVRVLADRDEIRVAGLGRVFFSTEALAAVEPFPGTDRPAFCPRCKQPLVVGGPAVRCRCGRWYHHDPDSDLPCYAYAERCALCPHRTALDGGYQWSPEGI